MRSNSQWGEEELEGKVNNSLKEAQKYLPNLIEMEKDFRKKLLLTRLKVTITMVLENFA